jgi:hypothetical protein
MDNPTADAAVPTVPIRLKLSPDLFRRADMQAAAVPAITAAVAELLSTLGIPGRPEVSWEPNDEEPAGGRPVAIYANGRLCRYSDELMALLYSYVQGKAPLSLDALDGLPAWLTGAEGNLAAEWLALLCRQALGREAGVLLGAEQAQAYCAALALATDGPACDPARLAPILARVLDLGIAIADQAAVAAALDESADADDAAGEALISKLRPGRIEVRMEESYLRRLSIDDGARGPQLFTYLRDGLFSELGVAYPHFQIVADGSLRSGGFAFTVNHLPGVPLIGLPPDRILVSGVPDRLRPMEIAAEPALNPATYAPCALAPLDAKDRVEAAGLTTWDSFEYLILSLAGELRAKHGRLVDRSLAQQMVEHLGKAFPELERAAKEHLPLDQVTAVLRGLAAEQISIRNLRRILESMLEHELTIRSGAPAAERLIYVRQGLADAIAHRLMQGAPALVAYVLDPAVEQAIADGQDRADADLARRLMQAIRAQRNVDSSGATGNWWPILVGEAACTPLRATIAGELPRMRVLSYSQLPPDLSLLPVARIGLPG